MSRSKSRVHPKYKTKYRVGNWAAYDRSLVDRGRVTRWLSPAAIAAWTPAPTGRRREYEPGGDDAGKRESGYHRQRRVESTCFGYKTILGGSLPA